MLRNGNIRLGGCVALLLALPGAAVVFGGPDTLHLYGPLDLDPAIEKAAIVFASRHGVEVKIATGPIEEWKDPASLDGDIVYCSGAFILSDFIRDSDVLVDETSVIPLKIRPPTILVRPGQSQGHP